jgi:NAD(P) transhydrogenase
MKPYDLIVIGSGPGGPTCRHQLKRNGVDVIHGTGKFTDAHHLQVENGNGFAEFEGQYIVIATGTKPAANSKVPINGRNIHH